MTTRTVSVIARRHHRPSSRPNIQDPPVPADGLGLQLPESSVAAMTASTADATSPRRDAATAADLRSLIGAGAAGALHEVGEGSPREADDVLTRHPLRRPLYNQ